MKAVSLVLAFLVGFYSLAGAQHFGASVQRYGIEQGLAHREVNAIFQDRRDFMWFGTKLGLSRFDGATFTTYTREKNGLDFDDIHSIAQDADGLLWLMGPEGKSAITLFNPVTGQATSFEKRFHQPRPNHPLVLPQIQLLNGPDGTIFFIDYQPAKLTVYHPKTGLRTVALPRYTTLTLAAVTSRNTIWAIANQKQLVELTSDGRLLHTYDHPGTIYTYLGQRHAGTEFFYRNATDAQHPYTGQLYKIDGSGRRHEQSNDLIKPQKLQRRLAYAFDRNGLVWNGYQLRDSVGRFILDISDQLASGLIDNRSFFRDKIGGFWLGTSFGLYQIRISQNYFQRLFYESGNRKQPAVRGITAVGDTLYTNLENGLGLFASRRSGASAIRLLGRPRSFNSLSGNLDGKLYLGEGYTLFTYDYRTTKSTVMPLPGPGAVWTIHPFSATPHRLLAGGDPGLWLVDPATNRVTPFRGYNQFPELAQAHVLHIGPDRQGTIWLCATTGFYTVDPQQGVTARYWRGGRGAFKLPADSYQHFYQDPDGHYWLATANAGLVCWDRALNRYRQFKRADGLNNDNIYAVYADRRGHLWLSSDNGIMQFDPVRLTTRTYTVQEGITHNEFNRIAHHQDKQGRLYFGGLNGVTAFDPRDFEAEPPLPSLPLQVVSFRQFDADRNTLVDKTAELLKTGQITLLPDDRSSILDFALLNYTDAQKNTYAYQFRGVDNTWRYQTESSLRLGNLPYGDHELLIRGQAADGRMSSATLSIGVRVLRPFYLRGWFAFPLSFLLLGGVWAWGRWREWQYQQAQIRLQTQINEATQTIARQAQYLLQLDEAKSRFFANITHDFRTPLTLILSPVETLLSELKQTPYGERLILVERNARQLLGLVNQLMDLARLDARQMKLTLVSGRPDRVIAHVLEGFTAAATTAHIDLMYQPEETGLYWFDADKLERIVTNLVANALKFTPGSLQQPGRVTVKLYGQDGLHLTVADTGIGLAADHLAHLFERFYQVEKSNGLQPIGTGLGLALVNELVDLQQGTIQVESQPGRGTTFRVWLPYQSVTDSVAAPTVTATTVALDPTGSAPLTTAPQEPASESQSADSPQAEPAVLLLVEDNDDMAQFITASLPPYYTLHRAADGLDGLEQARQLLPDLIISDVMMPRLNGYELCQELKTDASTDHIPVILLTAKVSLDSRMQGLRLGADEYLTKPFHVTELRLRVRNLLATQRRLGEKIRAELQSPETSSEPVHPFVQTLYRILDTHLDDSSFGAEELAIQANLSRMQLYRKLKTLVGLPATDFIREYRLKQSIALLQQGLSVSQSAYAVGFDNPSYFGQCFREQFGQPPSRFITRSV
ncbi:hybrid sensor histidine kinase/response regulator transcription factor [Spirosoma flavum]|uniref:histidine kinase n=1 Tax=Spirosoma flavum TaxID=2048557 RepID=A0ABW6AMD3_9BACT